MKVTRELPHTQCPPKILRFFRLWRASDASDMIRFMVRVNSKPWYNQESGTCQVHAMDSDGTLLRTTVYIREPRPLYLEVPQATAAIVYGEEDFNEFDFGTLCNPCRDCKGSGQYVGLQRVEACEKCGGVGAQESRPAGE